MSRTATSRAVIAVAIAALLTACSGSRSARPASPIGPSSTHRTLNIVAGENFWGSIVSQLAGRAGNVTSIVSDPNADPHDYETSSDDARAFAGADYVVLNGAGYDTWAAKLLSGNPNSRRTVLTIADLLGKKEGDNPHFWYNPGYVTQVISRVESDLKALDPGDSAYFDAQRATFDAMMQPGRARLAEITARFAGTPVAATESVFGYLGAYLRLDVISPPEFMQAVAEGNDPPAPAVAQFQTELTSKQAKLLVYNEQTSTAVTTNLKKLAAGAGIPVVGVTETIQPADATYEQWFEAELERLEGGLMAAVGAGGR